MKPGSIAIVGAAEHRPPEAARSRQARFVRIRDVQTRVRRGVPCSIKSEDRICEYLLSQVIGN